MCESQTSSITIPWELVEMQTLRPSLDLLSHNLHFTQIPRWFVNAFKFENCHFIGWTIEWTETFAKQLVDGGIHNTI